MSPIVWDLGHIANYEATWLLGARAGWSRPAAARCAVRSAGDAAAPNAISLPLQTPAEARAYLDDVRRRAFASASRAPTVRPLAGVADPLVAQHEAQHQETILQAIALREDLPYRPPFVEVSPWPLTPRGGNAQRAGARRAPSSWAPTIDAGPTTTSGPRIRCICAPFGWPPRWSPTASTSAFMRDGGYRRRELWCDAGWAWRQAAEAAAPGHWRRQAMPRAGPTRRCKGSRTTRTTGRAG